MKTHSTSTDHRLLGSFLIFFSPCVSVLSRMEISCTSGTRYKNGTIFFQKLSDIWLFFEWKSIKAIIKVRYALLWSGSIVVNDYSQFREIWAYSCCHHQIRVWLMLLLFQNWNVERRCHQLWFIINVCSLVWYWV